MIIGYSLWDIGNSNFKYLHANPLSQEGFVIINNKQTNNKQTMSTETTKTINPEVNNLPLFLELENMPSMDSLLNDNSSTIGFEVGSIIKGRVAEKRDNGILVDIGCKAEGFIAKENKRNKDLKVIITGGDADFLNKQLKNSIFASQIIHEPYLVLKGLNEVITL